MNPIRCICTLLCQTRTYGSWKRQGEWKPRSRLKVSLSLASRINLNYERDFSKPKIIKPQRHQIRARSPRSSFGSPYTVTSAIDVQWAHWNPWKMLRKSSMRVSWRERQLGIASFSALLLYYAPTVKMSTISDLLDTVNRQKVLINKFKQKRLENTAGAAQGCRKCLRCRQFQCPCQQRFGTQSGPRARKICATQRPMIDTSPNFSSPMWGNCNPSASAIRDWYNRLSSAKIEGQVLHSCSVRGVMILSWTREIRLAKSASRRGTLLKTPRVSCGICNWIEIEHATPLLKL